MSRLLTVFLGIAIALSLAIPSFAATGTKTNVQKNVTVNITDLGNTVINLGSGGTLLSSVFQSLNSATYTESVSFEYKNGQIVAVTSGNLDATIGSITTNSWGGDSGGGDGGGGGGGEPLVLDIKGNDKITTARHEWLPHKEFYSEFASKFDFTGDGIPDMCEWVSDNPDAILAMPLKGRVDNVVQLFGTLGGYANGFDKLSLLCDTDQNGWVEGEELDGLALWIDSNRDGICQPSELHSLDKFNIARISTSHKNFKGSYETKDGKTHTMWAWWPSLR